MTKLQAEGYQLEEAIISEMTTDGTADTGFEVKVDSKLLDDITEGDANPMFVTIEVLNESTSNNGRRWTREAIAQVAEAINSDHPDGYWGHLANEERATKFPDPTTVWLGAEVKEVNGKVHLYAKGYVLPEAKATRSYLKKAKAAGKHVAVSVYGKTYARTKAGLTDMRNFVLESIDWARPKSAGINTVGQFVITSEMTDDSTSNIEGEQEMTREEVLRTAKADELKELNSELVSEMTQEAVSTVEAEYETVVSEMTSLKESLGVDDAKSLTEVVSEMTTELSDLRRKTRESDLNTALTSEVESPAARNVIRSLVVSEMTDEDAPSDVVSRVLASDTGKEVIREFVDRAPRVSPMTQRPTANARKWTKKK